MQDNEFECDDRKAAHNAREHGVTFEKPRAALDNPDNVEEYDPDPDKERCSRLCRLEQDVFVVVYTERGNRTRISQPDRQTSMSNASTSGDERDKYGMTAENYRRLKARTDEEITAAALADPDHPPLTDERLARFRRPALARRIRQKLHMGRENFSATYGSPVETLRAWERHELAPTSHPGTLHVMELAEELRLTPAQRQMVQRVYERMKARAKALGKAYVAAEKAVDKAFKSGTADAAEVAARVAEANRLLGEVRLSHLQAHVEITPLLTPEQRTRYAELRGYAGSGPRQHMHKH